MKGKASVTQDSKRNSSPESTGDFDRKFYCSNRCIIQKESFNRCIKVGLFDIGIADKTDPQIGVDFSSEQGGKTDA